MDSTGQDTRFLFTVLEIKGTSDNRRVFNIKKKRDLKKLEMKNLSTIRTFRFAGLVDSFLVLLC